MPLTATVCACDWDADFGAEQCDPQTPGADNCAVIVCRNKIDTITKTEPDDTSPSTSGVITAVTLLVGESGFRIIALKDSINPNSSETLNDNRGKDRDENFPLQGLLSTENLNFLRSHMGREVLMFFKDNDGKCWCMGWDGGLELTTYNAQWGQQQGDFKGIDVTFSNTSKQPVVEVQVADVDAFLAGLIA